VKSYIGAIDQGHDSTRFMVFDKEARVAMGAERAPADFSGTGLGRAQR